MSQANTNGNPNAISRGTGQYAPQSIDLAAVDASQVSALLSGARWGSGTTGTVLTYSFSGAASAYGSDMAHASATLSPFRPEDRAVTRAVLDRIESVCAVRFVEVPDDGRSWGQLRYAYSDHADRAGAAGFAYYPSTNDAGGDVWLAPTQAAARYDYFRPFLVLHETLHALGLDHPFEGGTTLPGAVDTIANSVMSYSTLPGSTQGNLSVYTAHPMALDILALQLLYGARQRAADDTVYDLADAQWNGFQCIWDSGGHDTLDASRTGQAVHLDLNEGARSAIGRDVLATAFFGSTPVPTQAWVANTLALAFGTRIEDAIGSAFDDHLVGNAGDNVLQGGAGNDVIDGGGGRDRLLGGEGDDLFLVRSGSVDVDGGSGVDRVVFAGSIRDFVVQGVADGYRVSRAGTLEAVLRGVEHLEFDDARLSPVADVDTLPAPTDPAVVRVVGLYKAAFDRLPDPAGLVHHTGRLAAGAAFPELAGNFMASPEFTLKFAETDDSGFVHLLYRNVLGRAPDPAGFGFHLERLASGVSRPELLASFAESPENQAQLVGVVPLLAPDLIVG